MSTELDQNQILQKVYNEDEESLNVTIDATVDVATGIIEVSIDQTTDSIKLGDGTNLFTSTNISGKQGLDVNVINPLTINQPVSVSQSGTWNLNNLSNITGTVSLPTGASTAAIQSSQLSALNNIDGKIDVNVSSRASESTLSNINSKLVSGNDIGDVTINNAPGSAAVNIQDGGNSITVDGNLGRNWTLSSSTDSVNIGNFPSIQNVNVNNSSIPVTQSGTWNLGTINTITNVVHVDDNAGSLTVDNNGTFAVQSNQSGLWSIQPLTNSSIIKAQLQDNAGNGLNSTSNQLQTRDVINNFAPYQAISVSTTAVEAKAAASRLTNRKSLWVTPTNGDIFWGSDTSVTISSGTPVFSGQTLQLSFTDNIPVYLIAVGTVNVRVVEGS